MYAFAEYVWLSAQLWWPAWVAGFLFFVLPCIAGALVSREADR